MYNSDTSHVSVFLQAKQGNTGTDWCILVLRPACWPPLKLVSIGVVCYLCHNICANITEQKKKQFSPDDPCSVCARYGDVQSCSTKLGHFRSMTSGLFRVHTAECGRDVKRCWEIGHPSTSPVCQSSENRWIALTVPTMCLSQFECVWFNALEGSVRDGGSAFGFIFALLYL